MGADDFGEGVGDGGSLGGFAEGVLAVDAAVELVCLLADLSDAGIPSAGEVGNLVLGVRRTEEALEREAQGRG